MNDVYIMRKDGDDNKKRVKQNYTFVVKVGVIIRIRKRLYPKSRILCRHRTDTQKIDQRR